MNLLLNARVKAMALNEGMNEWRNVDVCWGLLRRAMAGHCYTQQPTLEEYELSLRWFWKWHKKVNSYCIAMSDKWLRWWCWCCSNLSKVKLRKEEIDLEGWRRWCGRDSFVLGIFASILEVGVAGEQASQGKGQHRRPSSQLKAPRPRDVPEFEAWPAQPVTSLWAFVVWHFVGLSKNPPTSVVAHVGAAGRGGSTEKARASVPDPRLSWPWFTPSLARPYPGILVGCSFI